MTNEFVDKMWVDMHISCILSYITYIAFYTILFISKVCNFICQLKMTKLFNED